MVKGFNFKQDVKERLAREIKKIAEEFGMSSEAVIDLAKEALSQKEAEKDA